MVAYEAELNLWMWFFMAMLVICRHTHTRMLSVSDTDSTDGLQLKKDHALRIFSYINSWTQRQCLCCFKEYKHLEVFNQVVYALINLVVTHVQALQNQLCKSCTNNTDSDWADVTQQSDEPVNVERDSNEEEGESEGQNSTESKPDSSKACGRTEDVSAKSPDAFSAWNTEEKEKLLLCVAKIFQIQFPLYTAYKHNTHPTIEDISAQESNILGSFCDMNNQLHTFNDVCNNESLVSDTETSIAKDLADWLINNNVVEHIFGPNLHIELKHCSRYIHDLFPSLIKNLDPVPLRHLLNLVSALHPSAHTEQTLYLASMLIKALWNNALAAKAQLSKQSSFASLLNTNLPMGNKKGSPAASPESSDNSDTHHSGGSDIEMDEPIMNRAKRVQQRLSDTEESMQGSSDETANSGEDASSGPGSSSGRSDGSSNEVNSSHASQSAGSPGSEVHSEDMADSEALKEEEEEEEEVERGRSPQKECRNPELRKRKSESHLGICLGEPQGATDRSGANSGTGKDLPFNPEAVSSVDNRMRMLDACSSHPEDPDHDMAEEIGPTHLSQGSQDTCISQTGDFLGEAIGKELFNCRRFIGPQHHQHHPHHHHPHHHLHEGHIVDNMLSADDVSCSSSQVSAKSEKNMADFDGEESGCEEELVQINSHAELTSHLQQHLPNLASIYHEQLSQGPTVHKHQYTGNTITDINLDNVCKKGNTLLWDLVQDEDAVPWPETRDERCSVYDKQPSVTPAAPPVQADFLFELQSTATAVAVSRSIDSLYRVFEADKLVLTTFPPVEVPIAARVQLTNLSLLAKDAACPNKQCRVTQIILKKAYAASAFSACLANYNSILDADKMALLDAPVTPGHTFGPAVDEMLHQSHRARESTKDFVRLLLKRPPPPRKPASQCHPKPQFQRKPVQQGASTLGGSARRQPATPFYGGKCPFKGPLPRQQAQAVSQIHLSEGLINEAEKLLCSLVCWFTDRQIRMRFIEGCLENLANHRACSSSANALRSMFPCLTPRVAKWVVRGAGVTEMPQLKPEIISMTGLNLFQHLCNLARLATSAYDSGSNCELCGMDQLWGIALRAQSADVSRAAIQYINSYYINEKSARCEELHLNAENLSRRVWELLMLLPTCPNMLQAFQNISEEGSDGPCWKDLLRIKSPHKLLYALEIIEALGKPNRRIRRESTKSAKHSWYVHFFQKNTVKSLFGGVITNNVVSLESLDEVTIKDTLEGDNMYTCSQCGKKVRAEKRACFKKLPRILSFNTMRYTFNMVTMMKEKVNTHFSFPLRLDMTPYTEDFLMGKCDRKDGFRDEGEAKPAESYEYDLIGVTVHTGTADGGHYYSFIRDIVNPHAYKNNKWYLFNDAEVKTFDSAQLASECFGGEMTTKTYDSVTDKFMDFSFEKTHSAYMLFYKRVEMEEENGKECKFDVSSDLLEWIWHDNMQFLQDKNIFEHTYFGFMWQLCSSIPSTLPDPKAISLMTAKPTMLQWIELLTKQFNNSQAACEWFLDRMADDDWWPMQILIKCPNQIVRQMFQRLCIHVIQRLRPVHAHLYLQPGMEDGSDEMDGPVEDIGSRSCVTRFVKTLLSIMEHGVKPHSKHLTEYFAFLYEFAKMGEEESQFLLSLQAISIMVHFYMGTKGPENPPVEVLSEEEGEEEEEEEDILSLAEEKYRPAALEKMIALIALLVEQSRSERHLTLSQNDMAALTGGKGFPFMFQHIRDGINIRQTCNLIFSLCRYNNRLAEHVIEYNPSQCLDWLAVQTPRNKLAHSWVLQNMENWVERFLLAHNYPRVRTSAAYLLVSLIPSNSFRQMFRSTRSLHIPTRDLPLSPDTTVVLHQVYNVLLGLLSRAKLYVDAVVHGTTKLVQYFSFMTYCLISKMEKLMFSSYFMDLWNLFQPKLSEPAIATNHNKQALLSFWYNVCVDCPENVRLIVQNPVVTKNIAFNYILADHDDQDVVLFNRGMLPAYYGILRMCCEQSPAFTRQLASHQNIQWAFKNLTPHASQYPGAVEELFNLMQLFVAQRPDMREEELEDIKQFKKTTISCYLRCLDGRSCWTTLISAFRILLETDEDRLLVVFNRGLILMTESFNTLHMMYHEATACHVTGDLVELLSIFLSVLKATRPYLQRKDVKQALIQWQERIEFAHKLLTLLNSYSPPELRNACIDVLKELVLLSPHDFLHTLVPFLQHNHCTYHHSNIPMSFGPYFPCRENIKLMGGKNNIRPPRPELNMCLLPSMVETSQGKDDVYDRMLLDYFLSYHQFIHLLCRVAINCEKFTETLSTMAKNCVKLLCEDPAFAEYIKCILMDERTFLNSNVVYTFLTCFLLKVQSQVLSVSSCANLINILVTNLINEYHNLELEFTSQRVEVCKTSIILNADLRAFILMLSVHTPKQLDPALIPTLQDLLNKCRTCLQQRNAQELEAKERTSKDDEGATPVKRRRVNSDEDHPLESCSGDLKSEPREALTPASTSDTETRDSSVIDPGTEQDPPTPENVSVKEDKMELISSVSEDAMFCSRPSEEQGEGESKIEECKDVKEEMQGIKTSIVAEEDSVFPSTSVFASLSDMVDLKGCENQTLPLQDPETSLTDSCDHSRGLFNFMQQHDVLDTLCRTIESTISVVTKLPGKGNRAAS
ncbi:UNVERIFIED_CONTAM: hypothetical protein FKN15_063912 [Acipenser sinensis]